jgi:hypothetical protein
MVKAITLYSGGIFLKEWYGVTDVEMHDSKISFDHAGKRYTITGTWVLEED